MIRKVMRIILGCLLLGSSFELSASWKVLVYMDAGDDLCDMAIKNMSAMMQDRLGENVDFVIQLHAFDVTAIRYHLTSNGLQYIEEVTLSGNSKQDFINAARWAFASTKADHTMLIAWNHGWGILDPQWNSETEKWEMENDPVGECSINRSITHVSKIHRTQHKGFIFSVNPRSYLTNQDLVESLCSIQEEVLGGKKLDVLAFDTCMGAMFEVAYQIAPYVHYFVGNQTCSMRDGFNYRGIVHVLNQEPLPNEAAAGMVKAFDAYYAQNDESGIYTHTALDLTKVYRVKESLDTMLHHFMQLPQWPSIAFNACEQTPRVCLFTMYPDLVFYCKKIEEQIMMLPYGDAIGAVQGALHNFYSAVQDMVVARCGGSVTQDQTFGVAIYQPFNKFDGIDSSYYKTHFGRESQWIPLLEAIDAYAQDRVCDDQEVV